MQCMKCGREIGSGAVFCDLCLGEMAKYPVKPGTAVVLPRRDAKRPQERRPKVTPEARNAQLKKQNRALTLALVLALLLATVMGWLWLRSPGESDQNVAKGQNYSSGQIQTVDDD